MSAWPRQVDEKRFDRSAWLELAFAAGLVLLSAAQIFYRYTLPTDGWAVEPEPLVTLRLKGGLRMNVEKV